MFRKLRLRLTLINVLVVVLLFLLFGGTTYFIMRAQILNESRQLLQIITADMGYDPVGEPLKRDKRPAKYFSIKTNVSGQITDISTETTLTPEQLTDLVEKLLKKPKPRGEVEIQHGSYVYQKTPQKDSQGFVFIFVNHESDKDILHFLLVALSIGGLIYLVLAFYGSRLLADKAMVPIKKSWQRQQDFVADASHELRNPLAVIQTNLELIQGNPEKTIASQEKWLGYIQIETNRMAKLVDDLLFLARADTQQQLLEMKWFALDKTLQEIIDPFETIAKVKNIKMERFIESEIIFYGDENKIKQVVVILIDNAIKHTASGGVVNLKLQKHGSAVEINISDTGEGIAPEHLDKIFERFYRVDKARSRQQGGTGLGLAIADSIIKSHGGSVRVISAQGEGTTFAISFPVEK